MCCSHVLRSSSAHKECIRINSLYSFIFYNLDTVFSGTISCYTDHQPQISVIPTYDRMAGPSYCTCFFRLHHRPCLCQAVIEIMIFTQWTAESVSACRCLVKSTFQRCETGNYCLWVHALSRWGTGSDLFAINSTLRDNSCLVILAEALPKAGGCRPWVI